MEQVFVDKMTEGTRELGIVLSEKQMEQFYRYYELLVEWNKVMNLTGITELEEVVSKHFIDSLALVKAVPLQDGRRASAIDVGTGAGFPGLPLKIAFPNLKITLLDSLNKRDQSAGTSEYRNDSWKSRGFWTGCKIPGTV